MICNDCLYWKELEKSGFGDKNFGCVHFEPQNM